MKGVDVKREIIQLLKEKSTTPSALEAIEKKICKKYHLARIPTKVELLQACKEDEKKILQPILCKKPVRESSGICVITVVADDRKCVWGKCIYCPSFDAPKSYVGLEPMIQRAKRNNYDPFLQVRDRLNQYRIMGHLSTCNKIEIIVLGGTFLGLPKAYKENFIKGIFDGLNGFKSNSLEEAKKANEKASNRCVSFFLETRPDFCFEPHVDEMLAYGITGVEIGVQTIYPEILELIKRGHSLDDVIKATSVARDAGLKIGWHLMPGLPGSNFDRDLEMFKEVFNNADFRPDYLKIYPTLVTKHTELYEMWKRGEYKPYQLEELVELLARVKEIIPPYCRIQHVGRDIPANKIVAGNKKSNLRELVRKKAEELGIKCRCIRCREVGLKVNPPLTGNIKLFRIDYKANGGREIFLSFESGENDTLYAFLRLRITKKSHRKEINSSTAIVRELKVVGKHVPIGEEPSKLQFQHRGFGKRLLAEAERIAKEEFGKEKIVVMSGIGAREYYRKLGYILEGPYMSKLF